MGPIVLFDKSFVEMLNIDEATMFDPLLIGDLSDFLHRSPG
jgi:hypothetical protein